MGPSRPRNSTRARKAHPPKKSRRQPAPSMPQTSAANILLDVSQRLEVARAVVAVTAAGLRAERVDFDQDAATTLTRCVCDVIDEERDRLLWLARHCLPLARATVNRERIKAEMKLAREAQERRL
jgi:hypothetical protein